jgi:hypothetical protein
VDPVWHEWESPYATFANNPVYYADPSGDKPVDPSGKKSKRELRKEKREKRKAERKERRQTRAERWKNWFSGNQYINDAEDYIKDHGIESSQVDRKNGEIKIYDNYLSDVIVPGQGDLAYEIQKDYRLQKTFKRRPLKERLLDGFQNVLAGIGMVPVLGEWADLLDAGVSALRGDHVGAGLSLMSAVPIWGWVARGGKIARGMLKAERQISPVLPKAGKGVWEKGSREVKGGFKTLSDLGLKDGMKVSSSRALELGEEFLGKGYKELVPGSGRYVSADGTRVFRMGKSDITGAHGGGPHVNFETLIPNPAKPGKMIVDKNFHIYLTD